MTSESADKLAAGLIERLRRYGWNESQTFDAILAVQLASSGAKPWINDHILIATVEGVMAAFGFHRPCCLWGEEEAAVLSAAEVQLARVLARPAA